jgi:Family of unknown function (DUF6069)
MTTTFSPVDAEANAPTARAVAGTGLVAGIAASAATVAVALAAKAIDIPMQVAASANDAAEDIPMSGFVSLTLASTAIATLLALAFARYAKRPAHTFVIVSAVLTVVSFVGPLTAHHATTATRAVLELSHVVAAAIVIPAVARRLPQRTTRR